MQAPLRVQTPSAFMPVTAPPGRPPPPYASVSSADAVALGSSDGSPATHMGIPIKGAHGRSTSMPRSSLPSPRVIPETPPPLQGSDPRVLEAALEAMEMGRGLPVRRNLDPASRLHLLEGTLFTPRYDTPPSGPVVTPSRILPTQRPEPMEGITTYGTRSVASHGTTPQHPPPLPMEGLAGPVVIRKNNPTHPIGGLATGQPLTGAQRIVPRSMALGGTEDAVGPMLTGDPYGGPPAPPANAGGDQGYQPGTPMVMGGDGRPVPIPWLMNTPLGTGACSGTKEYRPHRNVVKLPPFDGVKHTWKEYLDIFRKVMRRNAWTPDEAADHLTLSLEGEPQRIVNQLSPAESADLATVISALTARFTSDVQLDLYKDQFRTAVRKNEENISEWGHRLRRYFEMIHLGGVTPGAEADLVDRFIDGMRSEKLQRELFRCKRDLHTLDTAVLEAQHLAGSEQRMESVEARDGKDSTAVAIMGGVIKVGMTTPSAPGSGGAGVNPAPQAGGPNPPQVGSQGKPGAKNGSGGEGKKGRGRGYGRRDGDFSGQQRGPGGRGRGRGGQPPRARGAKASMCPYCGESHWALSCPYSDAEALRRRTMQVRDRAERAQIESAKPPPDNKEEPKPAGKPPEKEGSSSQNGGSEVKKENW